MFKYGIMTAGVAGWITVGVAAAVHRLGCATPAGYLDHWFTWFPVVAAVLVAVGVVWTVVHRATGWVTSLWVVGVAAGVVWWWLTTGGVLPVGSHYRLVDTAVVAAQREYLLTWAATAGANHVASFSMVVTPEMNHLVQEWHTQLSDRLTVWATLDTTPAKLQTELLSIQPTYRSVYFTAAAVANFDPYLTGLLIQLLFCWVPW